MLMRMELIGPLFKLWQLYVARARLLLHKVSIADVHGGNYQVEATLENVGDQTTSVYPTFTLAGYDPKSRSREVIEFKVWNDTRLEPHKHTGIAGMTKSDVDVRWLLYHEMRFRLTRGFGQSFRFNYDGSRQLSRGEYLRLVNIFVGTGEIRE